MFDMIYMLLPLLVFLDQWDVRLVKMGLTVVPERPEHDFGLELDSCISVWSLATYIGRGARLLCICCNGRWRLYHDLLVLNMRLGDASVYDCNVFLIVMIV